MATLQHRFDSITGVVLAGGASRRMGRAKALLELGAETMVERQMRTLRAVCRCVTIVGPPDAFRDLGLPVLADAIPGRGPLGGLYTGLGASRTEYNLILGCDLPFIGARFLGYLVMRAVRAQADVTVPQSRDHGLHPLCGVYRRRALRAVRAALEAGENQIRKFFPRVRAQVIPWPEIARVGFSPRIFDNMNTREDYEAVKQRWNL